MGEKRDRGRPVNLSDLLKITPVANEILRLSGEMSYSPDDLLWMVGEMMDGSEGINYHSSPYENGEEQAIRDNSRLFFEASEVDDEDEDEEDWDDEDFDELENEINDIADFETTEEDVIYSVSVKVQGRGFFPDMGFKADIKQKEDLRKFLNMVIEMIERFGS